MGESADSVYMYGYWNPNNRSWSGHWSQDKHLQGSSYEFSYSPKVDTSVLPKNPCENCRASLIDKDNVKNCAMCDRNGVHLTCVTQNPYYCMSCLEITRKFGQVPPVARSWYGYFELAGEQGQTIRYEDIMRLDFNYSHKSDRDAIVAAIIGKGENVFGTFVLKGYLIRAKRSGDATGDMLEIKLLKHYEVPTMVQHNPPLNLKVPYSVAPAALPVNPVVPVNAGGASSMSRQRRRPEGEEFSLDDDELGRNRKRPKTSVGKRISKTATFIASVGVEGNIVNLVDVWRTVSMISDPNLTVVCLSSPSASLPLKSILRVHQSNEQVATTLRSSSAMAACSAACQAVEAAIENQGVAISCASLDRKSQHSLPCAVAATYAAERYSRAVAVVDLCPQPMLLASALKTIPTITTFTAQRDGSDVRGWRQGIHAVVDSLSRQQFDILLVSMVLSEFDMHDYAAAMDMLGSVGIPMVVVVEDVSSPRAKDCARAVVDTLLRKYDNNSETSSSSIEPMQPMPNPIPFSSYSTSAPSTSHLALGGGPTPPPGSSSSGYPKSSQPMGMYQSLMKPTPPPVSQQGQQHPGVKVAPGGGGGGSSVDKSKMLQPGQSYPGIKQPGVMPQMHMPSSSASASSQPQQKPSLGMTVTAPNISRSGNAMGGQQTGSQMMSKSGPKPPAGVANGGSGIYGQSVGQTRSNGSNNPYPTPPNLQKQSSGSLMSTNSMPSIAPSQVKKPIDSGRTSSPKRQVSSSYGGQGGSVTQDQHPMYELPPDMLEPLPYTRDSSFAESMPEPQNPSPPQPVNNVPSAPTPASTVPQSLTIPTAAPPLERQDSWDMGMESPRPNGNNNNKFDYITASFKS